MCIDNLFTGSEENIKPLLGRRDFEFVKFDITRDLFFITSRVDGIYNLACPASPVHYQKHLVETILANTVGVVNILEIASRIKELAISRSQIVFSPLPEDDPKQRKPDITLAETKLNWYPCVGLEEGIKKTIDYFFSKVRHAKP